MDAPQTIAMPLGHDTARLVDTSSERARARCYPIARWYLRPAAGWFARRLARTGVRPSHVSAAGFLAALLAALAMVQGPGVSFTPALCVLLYWFFDRADGQLARCQGTASRWGIWLDGNIDELADVGLHTAMAATLAAQTGAAWPWWLLIAFLAGKYLLMYGLALEQHAARKKTLLSPTRSTPDELEPWSLRWAYHLPGNADVRIHLLIAALLTGWWAVELALIAVYYNIRWVVRYRLVSQRLGDRA